MSRSSSDAIRDDIRRMVIFLVSIALLFSLLGALWLYGGAFGIRFPSHLRALCSNVFEGCWWRVVISVCTLLFVLYPASHSISRSGAVMLFGLWTAFTLLFMLLPQRCTSLLEARIMLFLQLGCTAVQSLSSLLLSRGLRGEDGSLEENARERDGFEQQRKKVTTPDSFNFPMRFRYHGRWHDGWVNCVNPFRANSVIGTPGSGKSYAVLEPALEQAIAKGWSGVCYDYKDPVLSSLVYTRIMLSGKPLGFGYISFRHIRKSMRCNPLRGIHSAAEANDVAEVMLIALNRQFAEKQGEFFRESAVKFTAICIYMLGVVGGGSCLSVPHLITLLCASTEKLFSVLRMLTIFYPDMRNLFAPFRDAFDNRVLQQLQGQLASAQIGLGSMSDQRLAWVMTEDREEERNNIRIESVNDPRSPMWLCLGSDPERDTIYGLANSVYLSRLAKKLNQPQRAACVYMVDELTTVFIHGLDRLIATARSNRVSVWLGYQDYSQSARDYGPRVARAIRSTMANVFAGAVRGETAKELSESFGEKRVVRKSRSVASDGSESFSYAEQSERRIAQDEIEELGQGEFVGRMADDVGAELRFKAFKGVFKVDSSKKTRVEILDRMSLSDKELEVMLAKNYRKMCEEVEVILEHGALAADCMQHLGVKPKRDDAQGVGSITQFLQSPSDPALVRGVFLPWCEHLFVMLDAIERMRLLGLKEMYTPKQIRRMVLRHELSQSDAILEQIEAELERYSIKDLNSLREAQQRISKNI